MIWIHAVLKFFLILRIEIRSSQISVGFDWSDQESASMLTWL